jgi:hypothetical protein
VTPAREDGKTVNGVLPFVFTSRNLRNATMPIMAAITGLIGPAAESDMLSVFLLIATCGAQLLPQSWAGVKMTGKYSVDYESGPSSSVNLGAWRNSE